MVSMKRIGGTDNNRMTQCTEPKPKPFQSVACPDVCLDLRMLCYSNSTQFRPQALGYGQRHNRIVQCLTWLLWRNFNHSIRYQWKGYTEMKQSDVQCDRKQKAELAAEMISHSVWYGIFSTTCSQQLVTTVMLIWSSGCSFADKQLTVHPLQKVALHLYASLVHQERYCI